MQNDTFIATRMFQSSFDSNCSRRASRKLCATALVHVASTNRTLVDWMLPSESVSDKSRASPPGRDFSRPWHEVLHDVHARAEHFCTQAGIRKWSAECAARQWKFAGKAARLPPFRWLAQLLRWCPRGARCPGRPRQTWRSTLLQYCRFAGIDDWMTAA